MTICGASRIGPVPLFTIHMSNVPLPNSYEAIPIVAFAEFFNADSRSATVNCPLELEDVDVEEVVCSSVTVVVRVTVVVDAV